MGRAVASPGPHLIDRRRAALRDRPRRCGDETNGEIEEAQPLHSSSASETRSPEREHESNADYLASFLGVHSFYKMYIRRAPAQTELQFVNFFYGCAVL